MAHRMKIALGNLRRHGSLWAFLALFLLFAQTAQARIEATAFSGEPFGVATVSFPVRDAGSGVDRAFYRLEDEEGRTLYPVYAEGAARRVLSEVLGLQSGASADVRLFFLFKGDRPLSVVLHTPNPIHVVIAPQRSPRQHSRLLQQWWREYHAEGRAQKRQGDYPPVLQDYLVNMLGRRLNLSTPLMGRITERAPSETQETLELLLGVERLRSATIARTMRGERNQNEASRVPIPSNPDWPTTDFGTPPPGVVIEPLAKRTPHECFYIRFGNFANYLWLDHLLETQGGDLSRMAMLRGQRNKHSRRVQKQLALKKTALTELLGGQVIEDMAVIGRDAFLQDGAAVGVMFQARSSLLLSNNLNSLRAEALNKNKSQGATIRKVDIAGHKVSLLSTPDNQLRSFYVVDGPFHLVTNSGRIAERFLTAVSSKTTLGDSAEFAVARSRMPTSRDDSIFIYVSQAFFRGIVSPQYQLELNRRLQATTDLQLLDMARLAARNEGSSALTIADYIEEGFLPAGFGQRPDGSGIVPTDGDAIDSLRGRRGSFLPTPDVEITSVTPQEASWYAAKAESYLSDWKQFDPIMIGIQRAPLDAVRERVVIDGRISPLDESKYGWVLSVLGPPNRRRVVAAPGDIVNVQASLQGGLLSQTIPPHELFLGIQDNNAFIGGRPDGFLKTLQIITSTPGYLGSWPKAGYLDWLPLDWTGAAPDVFGYTRLPLGLWRRQWDVFSALSFQREVLDHVTPTLQVVEDPTPAQIRVRIGDLSTAQIRHWINQLYFDRAKQTTNGNLLLLHAMEQQLGLEAKDSKYTIEQILDSELVCTLGGKYHLSGPESAPRWTTSALNENGEPVAAFQSPIMSWFRGLQSHLTKDGDGVVVRAELIMANTGGGDAGLGSILNALGAKPNGKSKPEESKPEESKPEESKTDERKPGAESEAELKKEASPTNPPAKTPARKSSGQDF